MLILHGVTREQIRSALDRVLGTSSHRMLREIQSSILRRREHGVMKPMREFRAADFNAIGNVFRELRVAAEKTRR